MGVTTSRHRTWAREMSARISRVKAPALRLVAFLSHKYSSRLLELVVPAEIWEQESH